MGIALSSESQTLGSGGLALFLCGGMASRSEELCGRSAEELKEAGLAVRLAGTLLEGALGEGAQAEGAGEVIRVEAAAQGRDAAAGHWEATRSAQRAAPRMEMVFA